MKTNFYLTELLNLRINPNLNADYYKKEPSEIFKENEENYRFYQNIEICGRGKLNLHKSEGVKEYNDVFVFIFFRWNIEETRKSPLEFALGQIYKLTNHIQLINNWAMKMIDKPGSYAMNFDNIYIDLSNQLDSNLDLDKLILDAQLDFKKGLSLIGGSSDIMFGLRNDYTWKDFEKNPEIKEKQDKFGNWVK